MKPTFSGLGVLAAGLGLWLAAPCAAQEENPRDQMTQGDRTFLLRAADDGLFELKMAKIAQQQAASAAVREFARTLVSDHTSSNQLLTRMAERKRIALPRTMGRKNEEIMDQLSRLQGVDFDTQYMKRLLAAQVTGVTLFEDEGVKGGDLDVRALANQVLPTLRLHLQHARELAER